MSRCADTVSLAPEYIGDVAFRRSGNLPVNVFSNHNRVKIKPYTFAGSARAEFAATAAPDSATIRRGMFQEENVGEPAERL